MAALPLFPRWLRFLLLALTACRLAAAAATPLSPDEAYYWSWSRALAPGYLDHPPMVALFIRLGSNIAGETPFGIRLLGPIAALAGSLFLARAAEDFFPARNAGPIAAALLNGTLALNAGAVIITPDTPLLFFWTAALAALSRLLATGNPTWWLAFGLCTGAALASKYTAALPALGVLVWLLLDPRGRAALRRWQCPAAALLAVAVFSPVLAWNAAHHWASFVKQGGRGLDFDPSRTLRFLAELAGGQLALATPLVAALFLAGIVQATRQARASSAAVLLAAITLLPAAVFLEHALGARVQANWPGILYPGAAIAAAGLAPRLWRAATILGTAMSGMVLLQAAAAPLPLPRALDFTLIRLAGWQDLAGQVYAVATRAKAGFIAADEYGLAAELAYRLRLPVIAVEPERWALFRLPAAPLAGRTGLLILSGRSVNTPTPRDWQSADLVDTVQRGRGGIVAESYRLYRVEGAAAASGILLPARVPDIPLNNREVRPPLSPP